jgi:hypothetical protein
MKIGVIIGISVLALVLIVVLIFALNKGNSSTAAATAAAAPLAPPASEPLAPGCTPYSKAEYQRAVQTLRSKCGVKLIIPIVGVGAYAKCMAAGKGGLPPIC